MHCAEKTKTLCSKVGEKCPGIFGADTSQADSLTACEVASLQCVESGLGDH